MNGQVDDRFVSKQHVLCICEKKRYLVHDGMQREEGAVGLRF